MGVSLISTNSRVEVPFIAVKIGDYTFGLYNRKTTSVEIMNKYYSVIKVTYPNYMKSLEVTKINGSLNTYTLTMEYPITEKDDPNLIDKILSTVQSSRKIAFTYGDCATPSFMYRNEEGIITNVQSAIDIANSKITYTISAISTAINTTAGTYSFPSYSNKKPSDVIKSLLFSTVYGLQDIFYGMHDKSQVLSLGLIASNDRPVSIDAKQSITILDYLKYLVSCMIATSDSTSSVSLGSSYVMTICDDTSGVLDGPYFKVTQVVSSVTESTSIDYYTIDIGYPNKDIVTSFTVDNNESYAILYDYAQSLDLSNYGYEIDDYGTIKEVYSPTVAKDAESYVTHTENKTWWSQVTQYPISATLTIKGLLRAAVLMSYIRVNVYFYGRKYNASGVYLITKQVDSISERGYTTTLSLTRIKQDDQGEYE